VDRDRVDEVLPYRRRVGALRLAHGEVSLWRGRRRLLLIFVIQDGRGALGVGHDGTCLLLLEVRTFVEARSRCAKLALFEQDCNAVGTGRVLIAGRPVRGAAFFRFRRTRRTVAAAEEEELSFRVSSNARRAIRRAVRRGRRVRAKVRVTVTDAAGNRTVRRRTLKIIR